MCFSNSAAKLGHLNPAKTRAFRRRNKHEFTLQLTLSMVTIRWFEPRSCSMNLNSSALLLTLSMVRIRWFEPRSCSMNLYSSALLLTLSMVRIRWFEPRSCSMDIRRTCRWAESLYRLQINKKTIKF